MLRSLPLGALVVTIASCVLACGSSDAAPAGPPDAASDATTVDAASDAAVVLDAGPPCVFPDTATAVSTVSVEASALPMQTGGPLVSGTYDLRAYAYYGGSRPCDGARIRGTLVVNATSATTGTFATSQVDLASPNKPSCTGDVAYETSGAHFLGSDGGVTDSPTFSTAGTTLTIAQVDHGACGSLLITYAREP